MFKPTKLAVALVLSLMAGCSNLNDSYQQTEKDYQQFQTLTAQYQIDQNYWTKYNDPQLNQLVEKALTNNKDLAKAAIAVNMALYRANLVGANLVPNFSGKLSASSSKNTETGQYLLRDPANPALTTPTIYNGSVNIGYTLDLWQRMTDKASAAEWEHSASQQDLIAAKLSLVNAVVSSYFQLAYLKDAVQLTEESVADFGKINRIMHNKKAQGLVDGASTNQTEQALFSAENRLSQLKNQQKITEGMLRNLLNLKPSDSLSLNFPELLNVKTAGVNLNVPLSVIANRPDVQAKLFRLHSSFKDALAAQKSYFPTVTLGASLASQGAKSGTALHTPVATGLINIDLPFLAWNTVRWNVKISEEAYELARINFEQSITTALNDIDKHYFSYQQAQTQLTNEEKLYKNAQFMANYYKNRYNAGVTELRDWLAAKNTANAAKLALLNAKTAVIQSETAIFGAMGGAVSPKTDVKK